MDKRYRYEILNFWNDSEDLYVDYNVTDYQNNDNAHACILLNTNDIEKYEMTKDVEKQLNEIISKNNGSEFNLPRTSGLNRITYDIFKSLCESDNNMLWIENEDDFEMYNLDDLNYELLKKDIDRYSLQQYFELSRDSITVYGGLQCCFNDDREKLEDNLER